MKRSVFLFFFSCIFFFSALAQQTPTPTTLEGWANRLETFGKSIPQEQVFVHMDNTCYFLGDTIYYKAYVRRGDTGTPSRLSGVLYAELLNQDGYLDPSIMFELKNIFQKEKGNHPKTRQLRIKNLQKTILHFIMQNL